MLRSDLIKEIKTKESFLCVGLDVDFDKIPENFKKEKNPILAFNKMVIDATADHTVAYKPNIAFYEKMGNEGWDILAATLEYIPKNIFTIADAKRGDIGNTSKYYADTFFNTYNFDSVTIAPYMGSDSVQPFLEYENKWSIVLGLTSNKGALDFQNQKLEDGSYLFEKVIEKVTTWGSDEQLMFVVGATRQELLYKIRAKAPSHFLLVPGVGAQGGSLSEVCDATLLKNDVGLLVNSSRGIIYAGQYEEVKASALDLQRQMAEILRRNKII